MVAVTQLLLLPSLHHLCRHTPSSRPIPPPLPRLTTLPPPMPRSPLPCRHRHMRAPPVASGASQTMWGATLLGRLETTEDTTTEAKETSRDL
jgi:hypothetical protein